LILPFFLLIEVNANANGLLQWIQRDNMHSLFNKLKGTCKYVYQVQEIRPKWDLNLRKTQSDVYLMVSKHLMIITHVLVKKLKAANWSIEEAGSEAPSKIYVGVFTPSTTEQRSIASK